MTRSLLTFIKIQKDYRIVEISRSSFKQEVSNLLGEGIDWFEYCFPQYLVVAYSSSASSTCKTNNRASYLVKSILYGDVLVVPGENLSTRREYLYYMFRPEWIRINQPLKVSSDVFTKFGLHEKHVHDLEATELRSKLVSKHIPEFVNWMLDNSHKIISSVHVIELLHEKGINLRYLGMIYTLIPDTCKRLKYNIIGFQMLTRVIKSLLLCQLRSVTYETQDTLNQAIIDFFNLVLGQGEESDQFWKITMPIHICLKYGPFGFKYDPIRDNFHQILGHLMLFQLMQHHTGIYFEKSSEELFSPNHKGRGFRPLQVSHLVSISGKINVWKMKLYPYAEAASLSNYNPYLIKDVEENKILDGTILEKSRQAHSSGNIEMEADQFLSYIRRERVMRMMCLEACPEREGKLRAGPASFKIAEAYCQIGLISNALDEVKIGLTNILQNGALPGEVLLGCLYFLGLICVQAEHFFIAESALSTVLHHIQQLFDSDDDDSSASPFEIELHMMLKELAEKRNDEEKVAYHSRKLTNLNQIFDPAACHSQFRELVLNFLSFNNLSGISYDYTKELTILLEIFESECTIK